jgi:membrane protein YqaA with SNARE-associated domain
MRDAKERDSTCLFFQQAINEPLLSPFTQQHASPHATHHKTPTDGVFLPHMPDWSTHLLQLLALPELGLSTVFVVSFVSATLLPLGSEPAVFGLIKLNPELFWPTILVATAGNTLGGGVSWFMGLGTHKMVDKARGTHVDVRALKWLERFGPKACLLSWLPVVGDPLCAVAGWMKFPFWPCLAYMAIGKFARYLTMTAVLLWIFPGVFTP